MNRSSVAIAAKLLAGVVCGSAAVYFAGLSSGAGAAVGGLKEGGWNWQFLMPVYLGWLFGLLLTIGVSIYVFSRSMAWYLQLSAILFVAPSAAFAISAAYHFVTAVT